MSIWSVFILVNQITFLSQAESVTNCVSVESCSSLHLLKDIWP